MRRVIKIGGSLLLRPDLPHVLLQWFGNQREAENLVVVGGGELIDAIRKLDQLRPGDPTETHWRCVELMETTRQIVSIWFDWDSVLTSEEMNDRLTTRFSLDRPTLVAVKSFYDRNAHCDAPTDWRTTSDTIAAILATKVKAEELVLLKSCTVDQNASIVLLTELGIIDAAMPAFAAKLNSVRVEQLK